MINRMVEHTIDAFSATYGGSTLVGGVPAPKRALVPPEKGSTRPFLASLASAFIGWQYKYTYKPSSKEGQGLPVVAGWDYQAYNIAEQVLFFAFRIPKNIVKLGTEFIPNFLALCCVSLSETAKEAAEGAGELTGEVPTELGEAGSFSKVAKEDDVDLDDTEPGTPTSAGGNKKDDVRRGLLGDGKSKPWAYYGYYFLHFAFRALSFIPWAVAKIGQSITSPITAMRETYNDFAFVTDKDTDTVSPRGLPYKGLGVFFAMLRGLFSLSIYVGLAVFLTPIIGTLLASGGVGASIVAGLATAANWVAGLPLISALGSAFATAIAYLGTTVGLSIGAGFVTSAAVASTTLLAIPTLTAIRTLLKMIPAFKPDTTIRSSQPEDNLPTPRPHVNDGSGVGVRVLKFPSRPLSKPPESPTSGSSSSSSSTSSFGSDYGDSKMEKNLELGSPSSSSHGPDGTDSDPASTQPFFPPTDYSTSGGSAVRVLPEEGRSPAPSSGKLKKGKVHSPTLYSAPPPDDGNNKGNSHKKGNNSTPTTLKKKPR